MQIGQRIKTDLGEVIVLDIKEKYLILFSEKEKKFIKANDYDKNSSNKYFWQGGEYYISLDDLVKNL
ncbi:MAG: hypothetical protein ACTHWZ_08535 [Peptoniphilaceae bacterium]